MVDPEFIKHLTGHGGLANRLKAARGSMPAKELAERAEWQASKVSKIEAGKQLPSEHDLETWADITGIDTRVLDQLKGMLSESVALRAGYAQRYRSGQSAVQKEYNDLAEETQSFRFFETAVVPRYLQVYEYTKVILTEHGRYSSVDDIAEAARERQKSVNYLYTDRQFELLLNEPVLRWTSIPSKIRRSQLDRLNSVIGLDNVRLGIYPSLSAPVGRTPINGFELFDDIGYVETWIGDGPRLLADQVSEYDEVLAHLWQYAVEGDAARELINRTIADLSAE